MAKSRGSAAAPAPTSIQHPASERGNPDESRRRTADAHLRMTTPQRIVGPANQNSQSATPRGSALLEDLILQEKTTLTTHFDHERIPGRVVHTRSSAACGFFELTDSLA